MFRDLQVRKLARRPAPRPAQGPVRGLVQEPARESTPGMSGRLTWGPVLRAALRLTASLLLLASAVTAMAQLPQPRTWGAVSYLSGGIGDDEEVDMRRVARDYSLLLELTEVERGTRHGRWTAGVRVKLSAGTDVVLQAQTDGPLVLVKLKPGKYLVEVDLDGFRQVRSIEVKAETLARERFFWIVEGPLTPR